MDEPTSALSPAEVDTLFAVIERLKSRGVAIIYVSHKLDEIYRIADRVTVFRDGKRVVTEAVPATTPRQLVTWMVGRDLQDLFPKSDADDRPPLARRRSDSPAPDCAMSPSPSTPGRSSASSA